MRACSTSALPFTERGADRLSPHEHGHCNDETGVVAQGQMTFAHSELAAQGEPALRKYHLRLAEPVRHHADVANPYPIRESRAERLRNRLFRGEPHGEEA